MNLNSMQDLFVQQLRDLYSAETQFAEAQPKMVQAASNSELKEAFEQHVEETKGQIERLERVAQLMEGSLEGELCEAAQGLVQEGQEITQANGNADVKDAGLIAAAQRIEHYEVAAYGSARTYAEHLGLNEVRNLL